MTQSDWIFGYGSLMWKTEFPYQESRVGYIKGWSRRFYQGSPDHRGTQTSPGRVVTLIAEPNTTVWGRCFRLPMAGRNEILAQLDYRERAGYQMRTERFYSEVGENFVVNCYIAEPGNPDWLGPTSEVEMAKMILTNQGRSGSNREYVSRLAESLREIGATDLHVFTLEKIMAKTGLPLA